VERAQAPSALKSSPRLRFLIGEEESGERLDRALAALSGLPRARVQRWIEAGRVRLDGGPTRASMRVRVGAQLEAEPPEVVEATLLAEPIEIDVLHEDEDLVVVNKPAGLVVHPGPGHPRGTLVNALLYHCDHLAGIGGVMRPGIVHRLDRGTSGVLVVAKNDFAHAGLADQFHDHSIERVYQAFVKGAPSADSGHVDRAIGRHPRDRKRMSVVARGGRASRTAWSVRRRFPARHVVVLDVRPETGRTHQIRVHLASAGLPILGDPVYGRARVAGVGLTRPALHAARLGFEHPRLARRLHFEAPLPPDLADTLAVLERGSGAPS